MKTLSATDAKSTIGPGHSKTTAYLEGISFLKIQFVA